MINGLHALIYCKDPQKVRAFFRDTLGYPYVDTGEGWLIFSMPPAELGIHPGKENGVQELYLMCDDLEATVTDLHRKGVRFKPVKEASFGFLTSMKLPGGGELGLYQPKHKTAIRMPGERHSAAKR